MPGPEEGYISILRECAGEGFVKGEAAEDVLRKGFTASGIGQNDNKKDSTSSGTVGMRWDDLATEYQLDIERWIIEDKRAGDMAKRAFISHVRAYATHVVKERNMFDVKALHLGHLAKAFALRDRPGNMGRGTSANGKSAGRRGQGGEKRRRGSGGDDDDVPGAVSTDGQDAAKKMRAKMREQSMAGAGASEFNIG